jgi:hypothetical protein
LGPQRPPSSHREFFTSETLKNSEQQEKDCEFQRTLNIELLVGGIFDDVTSDPLLISSFPEKC